MSEKYLAFDTSNYTTSAAVAENGEVISNVRILLKVDEGERGLRQSDALFLHTVNIPEAVKQIGTVTPAAVGCSDRPRDVEGSYMPCFLAGVASASALSSAFGVPLYRFSHQSGHVAAALYSAGKLEWICGGEFLAFHVSGGTTEVLYVKDGKIENLGGTLDISAGKLIDRTGVRMGLRFPCGAALEELAKKSSGERFRDKVCVNGCNCNLSGVENKLMKMENDGVPHEEQAMYVQNFVLHTITAMTENALKLKPGLPILYAGGVMSNSYISSALANKFDGYFAKREFSCDNAAGVALLTMLKAEGAYAG